MANRVVILAIDEAGLSHTKPNSFIGKDGTLKAPPQISEVAVSSVKVEEPSSPQVVPEQIAEPAPVIVLAEAVEAVQTEPSPLPPPPEKKRGGRPRKNAAVTEPVKTESV